MKLSRRSLAVIAGILLTAWLAAGNPAAAHEGTAATVPAAPATPAPGGDAGGTDVLQGVAEYVPLPVATMSERTSRWSALWDMAAATAVLASGAGAVAGTVRRRRGVTTSPGRLQITGALALLFAGVGHCALAPSHWSEGWHLGAFFAASGVLLVGQAAVLWLRPSVVAYRSVVLSTAVMVVLYVAARQVALPLIGHRDPYLVTDIPVKVAEVLAAGLAVVALLRARPAPVPAARLAGAFRAH